MSSMVLLWEATAAMAGGSRLLAARSVLVRNVFLMSSMSGSTVEEESRHVRVLAWWDFKSCNLPAGFDASKVAPTIMEAVRATGIKGPLSITGFGDVQHLSRTHQEALAHTGVRFSHLPNGGRNSSDILVDLMFWVSQNPPPAYIFFISGDKHFAGLLHRLRMSNYNILLATPDKPPTVLHSAATIAWQWNPLLKGENLTGNCFNHPPDGPFGSWYGASYKLENPVLAQQSASLPNVDVYDPSFPNSVASQVTLILSMHPQGISITDLRAELAKSKCDLRSFGHIKFSRFLLSLPRVQLRPHGHGYFTVHLAPLVESPQPCESSSVASKIAAVKNEEEEGCAATPEVNGEDKSKVRDADEKFSIPSLLDDDLKSVQQGASQRRPNEEYVDGKSSSPVLVESRVCQPSNELQKSSVSCNKVADVANTQQLDTQMPPKDNKDSNKKMDSLKITSQSLSHNDTVRSEDAENDQSKMEDNVIANYESGNFDAKNKYEDPTRMEVDEFFFSSSSSPVDGSPVVLRRRESDETNNRSPTLFHWIRSWWPFGKSNAKYDDSTAHQNKVHSHVEDSELSELDQTLRQFEDPKLAKLNQNVSHDEDSKLSELDQTDSKFLEPKLSELDQNVSPVEDSKLSELDQTVSQIEETKLSELDQNARHSGKPELFSSASFWNEMESFIFSPKGSLIFSQSRSREDLVHKFQNGGPIVFKSLPKKYILQLVELLIAEKKWLEESPSQTFPFKLSRLVQKNSLVDQSHSANGLRSLFRGSRTSQSTLQKSSEHDVEKHNQNISHTRVSALTTEAKYAERSRNDILVDCQKLVSGILREHPEGYNIGSFRRRFVDSYGYHLDIQKLGYQKLAALLQIMPGVKIESTYIFPSVPAVSDSDLETSILKTPASSDIQAASNSDSELSKSAAVKGSKMESPWEELGPIYNSDLELKSSQKVIELDTSKPRHLDYEPVVSDDEFSASEGDISCLTQSEEQRKPTCNEQDSSFWQAMDLWHRSKEEENSGKKSHNVDSFGFSLADILDSSTESTSDNLSKSPSSYYREKQRSHKNYSFVTDPVLPNKDKLVDDFKKADESKMQN